MEQNAVAKKKIDSGNQRLASLLDDVTRGNIKIPAFQRDFVWTDEQILGLVDSIYSGYPVGSLLLWSTKVPLKFERNVGGFLLPEVKEDYPVNYVLDGQQRLTTLFGVFNADRQTENNDLAVRFNIHYVPELDSFFNYQNIPAGNLSIAMSSILDTAKLLPELRRFPVGEQDKIANLVDRFKDYEFPIVTIKERSNQEVCRIFQRINSSGTSLSTIELLTAWTWSEEFNLRSEMDSLKDYLSSVGYEQIDEVLLMRCLTAIINKKIDSDTLIDVEPTLLLSAMQSLKSGIHSAVEFLARDLKIKNAVFLPFPIMLVPMTYFFAKLTRPTGFQLSSLKRWFWCCAFSQRYKAGTNSFVMEDIISMDGVISSPDAYIQPVTRIETGFFRKTWRINSSAAKASICLLAQLGPRSFITGKVVDLETALSAYNARQFHHVYPKAFLSKQGFAFHESNIIANIAFLTAQDNNSISDSDPEVYFPKVHDAERELIFDSAMINPVLRNGDKSYQEFIEIRENDLIDLASKAMTGRI